MGTRTWNPTTSGSTRRETVELPCGQAATGRATQQVTPVSCGRSSQGSVCHLANPGSTESQSPSHCSLARSTLTTTLSPTSTPANVAVNLTRLSVPTQGVTTCSSPSSTPSRSSSTWQRAQECGWTDPSTSLCPTNTASTCTAMASR